MEDLLSYNTWAAQTGSVDVETGHEVGWVRTSMNLGGVRGRRDMVKTHCMKFSKISFF